MKYIPSLIKIGVGNQKMKQTQGQEEDRISILQESRLKDHSESFRGSNHMKGPGVGERNV
jgi:hypothetical protein